MILASNFCQDTVNAWKIAGTIVYVIKIAVPLLIIIIGTISFTNAIIKGNIEEVFEQARRLFFRLIAALLIFLIPTIIPTVIDLLTDSKTNSDMNICLSCIKSPNKGECASVEAYSSKEIKEDTDVISGNLDTKKMDDPKLEKKSDDGTIYGTEAKGNVDQLLVEAKKVTDYVRENNFNYGDAPLNPAINHDAKLTSCDRCVGWFLYNVGYTDQPEESGLVLSTLIPYLESHNFKKITNVEDIQAGDVMFVNPSDDGSPSHTFLLGNPLGNGIWERYDCGSVQRIRLAEQYSGYTSQPFHESVGGFMYAYRMPGA